MAMTILGGAANDRPGMAGSCSGAHLRGGARGREQGAVTIANVVAQVVEALAMNGWFKLYNHIMAMTQRSGLLPLGIGGIS